MEVRLEIVSYIAEHLGISEAQVEIVDRWYELRGNGDSVFPLADGQSFHIPVEEMEKFELRGRG